MKKLLAILFVFAVWLHPVAAQDTRLPVLDGSTRIKHPDSPFLQNEPPYVAIKSGDELFSVNYTNLNLVDPNSIQSLEVVKGKKAVELYGEKAKTGAIIITLHPNQEQEVISKLKSAPETNPEPFVPFVFVDVDSAAAADPYAGKDIYYGVRTEGKVLQITREALAAIDPTWIKQVEAHKDKASIGTYGKAAKDGAVIITFQEDRLTQALELLKEYEGKNKQK